MREFVHTSIFLLSCLFWPSACVDRHTEYEGMSAFVCGFALVQQGGKEFYVDSTGQYAFDRLECIAKEEYKFGAEKAIQDYRRELLNIANQAPKIVFSVYREKENTWGILAPDGTWLLLPTQYEDEAYQTYLKDKNEYPPQIASATESLAIEKSNLLVENYFMIKKNDSWGVYNQVTEKLAVPISYDDFDYCGYCDLLPKQVAVKKNRKWGMVDFNNEILVPFDYDYSTTFLEDTSLVVVQKDDLRGLYHIVKQREIISPAKWDNFEILAPGYIRTTVHNTHNGFGVPILGKYGAFDLAGNEVLPTEFDDITPLDDNHWLLRSNYQFTLFDLDGQIHIPLPYKKVWKTAHPQILFVSSDNAKTRQIYNVSLKKVFPEKYHNPFIDFENGWIEIKMQDFTVAGIGMVKLTSSTNRIGLVNTTGEPLLPFEYDERTEIFKNGYVLLVKPNRNGQYEYGIADNKGDIILPVAYEAIGTSHALDANTLLEFPVLAKKGNYWKHITRRGEVLPYKSRQMIRFD